jgi:hypothetical protein
VADGRRVIAFGDYRAGCSGIHAVAPSNAALSRSPTSENTSAVLIQHNHQIRPTEFASLAQLDGKNLGLTYRKFGARKSVSILIGENLRTVQNMEEISHRPPIIQATRVSSDK